MNFTIDITVKEARALRVISDNQGMTIETLMQRLVRQFVTGQIKGKYRKLFEQMNYNQLEAVFGTIEELYGWSQSSQSSSRSSSTSKSSSQSSSKSSKSSHSSSESSKSSMLV